MPNPHSNKPLAATTVAESKLAVSWYVGGRDSDAAMIFMDDLAKRLANRLQLTSDGHKAYLEAVEGAFGSDIDYAMLVKVVEGNPDPSTFQLATPPRGRVPASGFVAICRSLPDRRSSGEGTTATRSS